MRIMGGKSADLKSGFETFVLSYGPLNTIFKSAMSLKVLFNGRFFVIQITFKILNAKLHTFLVVKVNNV